MPWWLRTAFERSARPARYRGNAELRSAWTRVSGLRIHYRVGGAGDQILLVHGVGVSGRYLAPLGAELASRRAAYVPDLPGFGLSEHPALQPGLAWLADALVEFAGAVGLDRPAIVANSFGC